MKPKTGWGDGRLMDAEREAVAGETAGEPRMLADYGCSCGENPLWHPDERRIYWTDIPNGRLYGYDPVTGAHAACYDGEPVGGFTLQEDGSLLLFGVRGSVRVWREGALGATVLEEIADEAASRFNDVIADPAGRVFCGTMSPDDHSREGRLYRLDPDGSIRIVVEGVGCPNGMGFTPDGRGMYFTDSSRREIYHFDYDRAAGEISNRRVFARVPEGEGVPDGLTVDAAGCVWSARWDGSAVVCYAPTGEVLRRVPFPVRKVSSVAFGGDGYDTLYCTTAGGDRKDADGASAGALFSLSVAGSRGVPEFRSRIGL